MNIRFLCVFIFLMCAFTAGIVNAHTLHIGNKSFALSQTKYTTPSLNFMINGEHWYANLSECKIPIDSDIAPQAKIKHNHKTYYISDNIMQEYTKDYVIKNGKLLWANCDLYLEATGSQWINTGVNYRETDNGIVELDVLFKNLIWVGANAYFQLHSQNGCLAVSSSGSPNICVSPKQRNQIIHKWYRPISSIYIDNNLISQGSYSGWGGSEPYLIFKMGAFNSNPSSGKIFRIILIKNNVLVRHMVPVPAGLQIGDYTVPQNGMWDIVNQQFYGNSGTGSFIYGRDE